MVGSLKNPADNQLTGPLLKGITCTGSAEIDTWPSMMIQSTYMHGLLKNHAEKSDRINQLTGPLVKDLACTAAAAKC